MVYPWGVTDAEERKAQERGKKQEKTKTKTKQTGGGEEPIRAILKHLEFSTREPLLVPNLHYRWVCPKIMNLVDHQLY